MGERVRPAVDLTVNTYERTYRDVLARGFFPRIVDQNRYPFAGAYAVINNVDDPMDAEARAKALVASGELRGYAFVADVLERGLRAARLPRRALGTRPYFLDYGLAMAVVGTSPYILGWDAEVDLEEPADWVSQGVELLEKRADVFSCAPRWPARDYDTLECESIGSERPWRFGWGFSDQVWLVRRRELASPIWRRIAPAAWARNASHPLTFEARMESYQRAARRFRATHEMVRYRHRDLDPVMARLGETRFEMFRARQLRRLYRVLESFGAEAPRWRVP